MASQCNRDIECLTKNAQITFIGQVETREDTNTKYFAATVRPLCNMYSNSGSITNDEFNRAIRIGGFGNHAGGSCQAEVGNVGEVGIFFVHVNNTVANGGIRTFGLYDPCYGAFANTTDNYIQLTKLVYSENYTPVGPLCPMVSQDQEHIYIDGNSYDKKVDLNQNTNSNGGSIDLESTDSSDATKTIVMTSSALLVLFAFFSQLFL
ncbi:hypothetical protein BCR36DRAFT_584226 [Piromyces finnis]|uniref:Uncharacterized protein n=1 Tax=Piromyces finnis TaxID=1754191 RepID=A0A1Y1V8R5_9FUNG|nr:hypothetical protein BCR36DRAFT_584226 [Piromyces finnis]|eukprot:ORX48659.1 hypothetical protein BCR36DRAFT_584226 [Piromyces finnis]